MKPYEVIDHTADIGLRIYGRTLEELFIHAATGLFDLITSADAIPAEKDISFQLKGENAGDLLLQWLREWLFIFSTGHWVFKSVSFQKLSDKELTAVAACGQFDPKRHEQRNEVKAVTYHQFKLEKQKSGWVAEVIFDI